MKKIVITSAFVFVAAIWSCTDVKREPGRIYVPDMAYSRAYETYAPIDTLASQGINYNALPVPGTIKRGAVFPFPLAKDKIGDTANYLASRQITNPLPPLTADSLKEAERLYLVNCGICHGTKLDGNGPLFTSGKYAAAPKDLIADPVVSVMPDGQMFYSISYGKGQMGPYGPQLSTSQRWMIIHYIRAKQGKGGATPVALSADTTAKKTDTTVKK